jgi:hypothetical protein
MLIVQPAGPRALHGSTGSVAERPKKSFGGDAFSVETRNVGRVVHPTKEPYRFGLRVPKLPDWPLASAPALVNGSSDMGEPSDCRPHPVDEGQAGRYEGHVQSLVDVSVILPAVISIRVDEYRSVAVDAPRKKSTKRSSGTASRPMHPVHGISGPGAERADDRRQLQASTKRLDQIEIFRDEGHVATIRGEIPVCRHQPDRICDFRAPGQWRVALRAWSSTSRRDPEAPEPAEDRCRRAADLRRDSMRDKVLVYIQATKQGVVNRGGRTMHRIQASRDGADGQCPKNQTLGCAPATVSAGDRPAAR